MGGSTTIGALHESTRSVQNAVRQRSRSGIVESRPPFPMRFQEGLLALSGLLQVAEFNGHSLVLDHGEHGLASRKSIAVKLQLDLNSVTRCSKMGYNHSPRPEQSSVGCLDRMNAATRQVQSMCTKRETALRRRPAKSCFS